MSATQSARIRKARRQYEFYQNNPEQREKRKAYVKEWRRRKVKAGLCFRCGGENDRKPDFKSCSECAAKQAEDHRMKRVALIEGRMCVQCTAALEEGHKGIYCPKCRDRRYELSLAAYHRRRDAMKCTACGKPSEKACCDECRPKRAKYLRAWRRRRRLKREAEAEAEAQAEREPDRQEAAWPSISQPPP